MNLDESFLFCGRVAIFSRSVPDIKLPAPLLLRRTVTNDDKLIGKNWFLALQDSSLGLTSQHSYWKCMICSQKAGFLSFREGKRAMLILPIRGFNLYYHKGWNVPAKKTWSGERKSLSANSCTSFILANCLASSYFSCTNVLPQEDRAQHYGWRDGFCSNSLIPNHVI